MGEELNPCPLCGARPFIVDGRLKCRAECGLGDGGIWPASWNSLRCAITADEAEELVDDMVNRAIDEVSRDPRIPDSFEQAKRARAALMAALTGKAVKT